MKSTTLYFQTFCLLTLAIACTSSPKQASSNSPIRSIDPTGLLEAVNKAERPYVVINFFSSSCTPCQEEIPELVNLQNSTKSEAEVFLVSVDPSADTEQKLPAFLRGFFVNFPSFHLHSDSLSTLVAKVYPQWNTRLPLNFVYTNSGRLVEVTGLTTQSEINMIIAEDMHFHEL